MTQVAPYANLVAQVLKTGLPIAAPAANLYFGEAVMDDWVIQQSLGAMKDATGTLLDDKMPVAALIA